MTILADKEYKVNNIIVATGSKPKEIKGLEYDNEFILSSDEILKLNKLPKSILIVGSGAIGIESARIFSNFGVDTTIVEKEEHLIPTADIEVSKRIERIFKQHNIKIYTNDSIQKIYNKTVTLASGREVNPEVILIAIGRTPMSFNTNQCQTIGDACGEIQLAHFAIHQAFNLTRFKSTSYDKNLIPFVIYGEPEIAWVGLREQDCDEKCDKIMFPISALGKSWCDDSTEGFIKIIVKEERIVGAHIVSKEASALIHQILIAMQNNINIDNLKKICFAHPTYSEGILETLLRL